MSRRNRQRRALRKLPHRISTILAWANAHRARTGDWPTEDSGQLSTWKPVELATRAIRYSSRAGENVLDLFGGSGSTLIATEQTGRRAFLMELDLLYCDVIVTRWEKLTGRRAERRQRT